MKKRTRNLCILGAALILLLACAFVFLRRPSAGSDHYDNLIKNGDFSQLDNDGLPEGWYTDAYIYQGYTDYDTEDGAAHITNHFANDARFAQEVAVSPNSYYELRGLIRAQAEGGLGANLSIQGVYVFSQSLYDTEGEWQEVSLYGLTGEKQKHVTVFARLGGYSGEAVGEAWFKDITLRKVDEVPSGRNWMCWYAVNDYSDSEISSVPQQTGSKTLFLFCALYVGIFLLLGKVLKKREEFLSPAGSGRKNMLYLAVILLLGLILRISIAAAVPGYDVDIGCFRSWAYQIAETGPAQFYNQGFCDYPPGYLLILWIIGGIGGLIGEVTELMVKAPGILADLVLCVLLYTEGKKYAGEKNALAVSLFYALNPLVLISGAAWGQCDGVMTLLIFLTVLFALKGKWEIALPLYVVSVLVKPQALMFGPLGVIALVMDLLRAIKNPEKKKAALTDAILGLLLSLAAAAAIVLPFKGSQPAGWLIELYKNTMGEYSYATVNACNLYFLLGRNWTVTDGRAPGLLASLCVCALCILPCLMAYKEQISAAFRISGSKKSSADACFPHQEKTGFLLTVCLCAMLILIPLVCKLAGIYSYAVLNWSAVVFAVAVAGIHLWISGKMENLPLLGAAMLMLIFACGPMMHERYLFPAAALMMLSYLIKKDKRILLLALFTTLAGFLNVGCVLDRNIRIGGSAGHLSSPDYGIVSDMAVWEYLSSMITCAVSAAALYLSVRFTGASEKVQDYGSETVSEKKPDLSASPWSLPQDEPIPPMKKWDWVLMLGVTVLYAVLAFTNLGSTKAPQTAFVSASPDEEIVIDLGQEQDFEMLYYGGIHSYDQQFTVEISSDQSNWEDYHTASMNIGDCFKWLYVAPYSYTPLHGRYVRITASQINLTLFETLFRDPETKEPIQASILSDSMDNETSAFLIDEKDTLEGIEPSWYNSTYFDEIYHARTAYEHLHNMPPYETTHPPLGKVLMSFAVAIFGMTPFGWRFAGALAGVLMLPGMYLLGKLLLRRKWGGFGAMMLMALDLMHFTQTRIATIDSFAVLFIIWSVYFMLRWFRQDLFTVKFWKTLVPLALSGIFMGLSVASKWTGCYNGVGLAVLFFFGIARRYRQVAAARDIPENRRTAHDAAAAQGTQKLLITVASCLVFFIAVPLLIYYVSYIPYFAYNGGVTIQKVIEAAVGPYFSDGYVGGMLGYHSTPGLGMDHPYYSPWYEWPVIARPMWYFSIIRRVADEEMSIMAMGNPAVWWTGLAGILGVAALFVKRHIRRENGMNLSLAASHDDPRYALVLICFLAQFLPWTLVPRGTYIYHYFPSVPFIILSTLLCLDRIGEKHEKAARIALIVLLVLALFCFIALFPFASGVPTSTRWMAFVCDIFPMPLQF